MKTGLGGVAAIALMCCAGVAQADEAIDVKFNGVIAERGAEDWRSIANALIGNGKQAAAAGAYERLLELAPEDAEALTFLAAHAESAGDEELAASYRAQLADQ